MTWFTLLLKVIWLLSSISIPAILALLCPEKRVLEMQSWQRSLTTPQKHAAIVAMTPVTSNPCVIERPLAPKLCRRAKRLPASTSPKAVCQSAASDPASTPSAANPRAANPKALTASTAPPPTARASRHLGGITYGCPSGFIADCHTAYCFWIATFIASSAFFSTAAAPALDASSKSWRASLACPAILWTLGEFSIPCHSRSTSRLVPSAVLAMSQPANPIIAAQPPPRSSTTFASVTRSMPTR
mmetsp:Transcript_4416/g.8934  ORF Transcript_4416/g.8934 Transcript_4416/m.8934 type:complete len:244 (+) Transcript_4416:105-836(+)